MFRSMTLRSALVVFACSISFAAYAVADVPRQVNVLPGELVDALEVLAKQCGVDVIYPSNELRGLKTQGVSGTFETRAAFRKLIEGTPLILKEQEGAVLIALPRDSPVPAAAGQASGAAVSPSREGSETKAAYGWPSAAWPLVTFRAQQETEESSEGNSVGVTDEGPATRLGEMVVTTGSHIPGAETASPLFIFDQQDFDAVGAATAQQFFATLPQNFGGGQSEDTSGNEPGMQPNEGFGTAVNLRGLGPSSTLVLIDGRRSAVAGTAEFVDISMVPLSAVERIEVLTDGASAIYGSDAIGGVVNFVMRDDYEGAETRLRHGVTTHGEAGEYQAGQSVGTRWNTGGGLLSYEYYRRLSLNATERDFTANALGPFDLVPRQEKHSVHLAAHQMLGSSLELSGNVLYTDRKADYSSWDTFNLESTRTKSDNEQGAVSLGAGFAIADSMQFEVTGGFSRSKAEFVLTTPSDNGGFGPILGDSDYKLWYTDAKLTGDLFGLPGGDVRFALGGGYRDEAYEFSDSFNAPPEEGYDATSAYAELLVPLVGGPEGREDVARLLLTLAGRYESYSTFGSTFDPKFGVRWSPLPALTLRATYGTSFKVPSAWQLNEFNGSYAVRNQATPSGPLRMVSLSGNSADLHEETAKTWTAGIGVTPESMPGFHAQLTYFDIDYDGRILRPASTIPTAVLFNDPVYASLITRRGDIPDDQFNALIAQRLAGGIRITGCAVPLDPTTGACGEPVTNFNAILDRRIQNLRGTRTNGVDLTVGQRIDTGLGAFDLSLSASYLDEYSEQLTGDAPVVEFVDTAHNPVDLRAFASIGWSRNGWSATSSLNYTDAYTDEISDPSAEVTSWTTMNLNISYDTSGRFGGGWADGFVVSLNVLNVFDKDPPFLGDQINGLGYDPTNADPLGRVVALTVTKDW